MITWSWRPVPKLTALPDLVELLNKRMLALVHALKAIEAERVGVTTLAAGDTTPSVSGTAVLVTANTGATTVTGLDDGSPGRMVVVVVNDAFTTFQHSASLQLIADANFSASSGDVLLFATADGTTWRETPQPHRWS